MDGLNGNGVDVDVDVDVDFIDPPSVERRRPLNDASREDDYAVSFASEYSLASASTTESIRTLHSFQSAFSDMSKLRSLTKGEIESVP